MLPEKVALLTMGALRRATPADIRAIDILITRECQLIFGKVALDKLLQFCYMPICQLDNKERIIGFIALDIYPCNPAIPQNGWCYWIKKMYKQYEVTPRNSLFVHLICWERKFSRVFLRSILESIFISDPFVLHIIFVMPPGAPLSVQEDDKAFDDILIRINQENYCKCTQSEFLYIALRSRFCPKLKVRKAAEEDNDDLVAIIEKDSERIKDLYGDFYVSEMIAYNQGSDRTVLVAELNGSTVGVMILNSQVNYEALNECFELVPFSNLMRRNTTCKKDVNVDIIQQGIISATKKKDSVVVEKIPSYIIEHQHDDHKMSLDKEKKFSTVIQYVRKSKSLSYSYNTPDHEDSDSDEISGDSDDYDLVNLDDKLFVIVDLFLDDRLSLLGKRISFSDSWCSDESSSSIFNESMKKDEISKEAPLTDIDGFMEGTEKNAFTIEVFAMHDDVDERYGFDLLEVSFELFQDYEYCVMAVPTHMRSSPILEHFVFVPQRPTSCFDHSLYVLHRNCIKGNLSVRQADLFDEFQIREFLENIPGQKIVNKLFLEKMKMDRTSRDTYVMLTNEKIVAVGNFEPLGEYNCILHNYEARADVMPTVRSGVSAASIQHLIVAPQFQQHARFFLREVHRLSYTYEIYWLFYTDNVYFQKSALGRNTISTIGEFVPLSPVPIIEQSPTIFKKYKRFHFPTVDNNPFGACYMNPRVCSYPKINIDTLILIVGGSRTCFAFLETILFGPTSAYLTFTGITLVSHHGIPFVPQVLPAANHMVVSDGHIDNRYFHINVFQMYINVVNNPMTAIRRKKKFIIIDYKQKLKYDLLFLFCGKQYQHPEYLKELVADNLRGTAKEFSYNPDDCLYQTPSAEFLSAPIPPFNVFIINDIIDANISLQCVQQFVGTKTNYNIVVYGATVEAYCCLTALLEIGIPGSHIVFVEPFPGLSTDEENKFQVTFFNNEQIDKAVRQEILKSGITCYSSYYYHSWDLKIKYNTIRSVKFISKYEIIKVKCLAFFYYGKRGVDTNTFMALNECGLVYDGGLLIDANFKTNDSSVYAAGPLTKYSYRYNTKDLDHHFFSSYEIGCKLAEQILHDLNPYSVSGKCQSFLSNQKESSLVSTVTMSAKTIQKWCESEMDLRHHNKIYIKPYAPVKPIVQICVFPGNLKYLNVVAPGRQIPLEMAYTREDYGQIIETKSKGHYGYFRLHINNKDCVETITCLTESKLDVNNLTSLWGRHEQLLNKLCFRFQVHQIPDLFEYFREPWAYAMYHHKFDKFLELVKEILFLNISGDKKLSSVTELTTNVARESKMSTADTRRNKSIELRSIINEEFLNFVINNESLLPMYAHPLLVRFMMSAHSRL